MRFIRIPIYIFIALLIFIFSTYLTMKVILKSQRTVLCPDVIGKEVREAKTLVESKGLNFHIVRYEKRNDVPYNHITVQKPEANIQTKKGRTVMVIVSDGPELFIVPSLVGQVVNTAHEMLKEKNIPIERIIYVPNMDNEGKVIAQIPKGGEGLLEGKGIVIFAGAKPKRYVVMPDVTSLELNEITSELDRKNIKYKIVYTNDINIAKKDKITASVGTGQVFDADEGLELKIKTGAGEIDE